MKNQKSKIKNQKSTGVTLIELVVVLAIFMITISVTLSIFLSTIKQQKGILTEQELLNQTSYITEYMSRTMRAAIKDTIGSCIVNPMPGKGIYTLTHYDSMTGFYNGIKFLTENNICQEFFRDTDGFIKEIKNGQTPQKILSSKFNVKYLRFIINGNKNINIAFDQDSKQPRITFVLDITTQLSVMPGATCSGIGTCMALCPQGGFPTPDCSSGTICCPLSSLDKHEKIVQTTVSQINLNLK